MYLAWCVCDAVTVFPRLRRRSFPESDRRSGAVQGGCAEGVEVGEWPVEGLEGDTAVLNVLWVTARSAAWPAGFNE